MNWSRNICGSLSLTHGGKNVAFVINVEHDGRNRCYWRSFIDGGSGGFCDTLEQAQAVAERASAQQHLQ